MAREDIPGWIITALSLWGRQKRRAWISREWYVGPKGERSEHVDGYAQSLLGRIREEQIQAKHKGRLMPGESVARPVSQYWPEVFWGLGLDVQRNIISICEVQYCVLHLHYVWLPEWQLTISQKAKSVGIDKNAYWRQLENAEHFVHGGLNSASDCPHTQKLLRIPVESGTNRRQSATMAKLPSVELNLAALGRKKLSLVS
jgi:hypothetical protein